MDYKIEKPQEGKVTLEMTWAEAEIVTRLIGMANSGNLAAHAPEIHDWVEAMVNVFGRNAKFEANRFTAHFTSDNDQVYIHDKGV